LALAQIKIRPFESHLEPRKEASYQLVVLRNRERYLITKKRNIIEYETSLFFGLRLKNILFE
jgi:hypothetical protein